MPVGLPAGEAGADDANCSASGPTRLVSILIDTTDPLTPLARAQLADRLREKADTVAAGEHLEIATFDAEGSNTLFAGCRADGAAFTFGPRLAAALTAALGAMPGRSAERSPIMAALQRWAIEHGALARRQTPRELVLVSDMFERTDLYSHYWEGLSYRAYSESEAAERYAADLGGAKVHVFYLPNAETRSRTRAHIAFWDRWITRNRGRLVAATKVQGGVREDAE